MVQPAATSRPRRIASTASSWPSDHGSRSSSAASSRAVTVVGVPAGVDQPDPLRLLGGHARESRPRPRHDSSAAATPIRSPRLPSRARARTAPSASSSISTKVRSGRKSLAAEAVQVAHRLDAEPAGPALIGERAVEEAVAQHPFARAPAPAGSSCRHGRRARRRTAAPRPAAFQRSSSPSSSSLRIASAPGLPPGSRVTRTSMPRALQRLGQRRRAGSTCRPPPRLRG